MLWTILWFLDCLWVEQLSVGFGVGSLGETNNMIPEWQVPMSSRALGSPFPSL